MNGAKLLLLGSIFGCGRFCFTPNSPHPAKSHRWDANKQLPFVSLLWRGERQCFYYEISFFRRPGCELVFDSM